MKGIGIIAELNPLHSGHKYLLDMAKGLGTAVVALSGNFVQRGDTAIADKQIRTKAALLAGADLVLEIPVGYSMSTAQNFALGGVSVLNAVGCSALMFGSECGNIDELFHAADCLSSSDFKERLSAELKKGMTFAAARERAACLPGGLLKGANNNLAIEYISAARSIGAQLEFLTVPRKGAGHDSPSAEDGFASASLLRRYLLSGNTEACRKYMPSSVLPLFSPDKLSDIKRIDRAILAVLRRKTVEELKTIPDLSEGLENKIFYAAGVARSSEEMYNIVKAKRYTHARIRRLVLSAFLGLDSSFFMKPLPYVRVLGFNKCGEEYLRQHIADSPIPIVTRVSEITALKGSAAHLFKAECTATDMHALSLSVPDVRGKEYTSKIIKL